MYVYHHRFLISSNIPLVPVIVCKKQFFSMGHGGQQSSIYQVASPTSDNRIERMEICHDFVKQIVDHVWQALAGYSLRITATSIFTSINHYLPLRTTTNQYYISIVNHRSSIWTIAAYKLHSGENSASSKRFHQNDPPQKKHCRGWQRRMRSS